MKRDLPDVVKGLIEAVGFENTIRVMKVYGGISIGPFAANGKPEVGDRRDILMRLLGQQSAVKLFTYIGQTKLYIPYSPAQVMTDRNVAICHDADSGIPIENLVRKYQPMTERQIWTILKESADKK